MSSQSTINLSICMDRELKEQADSLFSELGMNMTTAMNVFVRQSVRLGKIPFEIALDKPNARTLAAIREVESIRSGEIPKRFMPVADFAKEMGE
ncbi:MAG: type II toxin-antitoxin system RelB/DinJ family antitoxin [Lachnospiraceae bacterium]|nr:type II toxin-antitoxin system RelB/DinJ family antitoxin [Lachnospiraceae bacterium]